MEGVKKKSFRQNKNLLTAKHENNKGFPIIPQQAGAETPPVAGWARLLPITSLRPAGVGLSAPNRSHPHRRCFHKKKPFYPGMLSCEPTAAPPSSPDSSLPAALRCMALSGAPSQAAQPQPKIMGASTQAANVAGVELTSPHPGKKPKP